MNKIYCIKLNQNHFPLPLEVRWISKNLFETLQPFRYYRDNGEVITVKTGFITDFGSKPAITWILVGSPTDEGGPAYVIHDFLCEYATWGHAKTDRIFLEALRDSEVSYLKRTLMYWAVKVWHIFH